MSEEKKDTIVVAREGYQVLLNVGTQNFDINCHVPVNLSDIFTQDTIDSCMSLKSHLEDGNLVYFVGQELPIDRNVVRIKSMDLASVSKIETSLNEKSSDITSAMQKDIQTRVAKNKQTIQAQDQKILAKRKLASNENSMKSLKERGRPKTTKELIMKVQMNISPEDFKKRQEESRKKLQDQEKVDHDRAIEEIREAKQ